ncbi:hypothetical protein EXU85_00520 [Spirosoma sp. KCTC 42546]|uniref:hypothetical protein n=1 Tax=Spirosoma sp. KCTC 42546 TaxID=2520506 RepID=UPI00115B2CF1|nr:hypothetical protein [Spirosoma sp. KCTC 42546]QDK77157.1 hypothetical protein EXU85_00520 [Spirosoma sp. KCTC 42546]
MDTIRLIYFFENNLQLLHHSQEFLENNFEVKFNPYNIRNEMDDKKLYRLYFIKNMAIKLYTNRVVIQGSIPIYYSGTNVTELTDAEIIESFQLIQFQLPFVNWSQSIVSRLDIGICFKLPFNPNLVTRYITGSKYSKKMVYKSNGNTTIIGNKSHQFEIYNKTEECDTAENNIIRLEYKMLKSLIVRKTFNEDTVTLKYLLNNLKELPKIWFNSYSNLEKDYNPIFETINNKQDLAHAAYHSLGYENCLTIIENSYKKNLISEPKKSNMKRFIRKLQKEGKEFASVKSPMLTLDKIVDEYICAKLTANNDHIN